MPMRLTGAVVAGVALAAAIASAQPVPAPPPPPARPELPRPQGPPGMPRRDAAPVPEAPGTAAIRGRIVAVDSGQPLRRVTVRIMAREVRQPRVALTDAEGRFDFKDLPAGRYTLVASKGGYVNAQFGERRPGDLTGRPIELGDGQVMERIQIALTPGGVITGRIVDELGEPIADATVSAQRFRNFGGRRRLMMAGRPDQSNDVGVFRIFGLPPGEYYVSASIRGGGMMTGGDEVVGGDVTGYAPTFYPGTASADEAHRVHVVGGQEVTADLQLVPTKLSRISGIVIASNGRPPQTGMIMAMPKTESSMFGGNAGQIRADGTFSINGLAPGSYELNVRANLDFERMASGGGPPANAEMAMVEISVSGEDLAGLRVVTSRGVSVSGTVVFEGGTPPGPELETRIMANSDSDGPSMFGFSSARVRADGTFELENLLGPRRINVAPPKGWMLKSVTYRGRDVSDGAVEFREAGAAGRLDVVLTNRVTTLSGTVQGSDGKAISDYEVVIFPEDAAKAKPPSRRVRNARPDQQGLYRVEGLPPGEYLILALREVDEEQRSEPDFFERLRSAATSVVIREGETRTLPLKLVTAVQ